MENIRIEKSRIEEIVEDYVLKNQAISIDGLTNALWEYIEKTLLRIKFPVTVRLMDGK